MITETEQFDKSEKISSWNLEEDNKKKDVDW